MSDHDPFNCPQCGAHDYGLFASSMLGCPHCLLAENTALTAKLEKANRDIEIECGAWADQVHALKVKLAAAEAWVKELEERPLNRMVHHWGVENAVLRARVAELEAAAVPTFFCQNAGYICERCGKHKYVHQGDSLKCAPLSPTRESPNE